MKTIHMCLSVRGALGWEPWLLKLLALCMTVDGVRPTSVDDVREALMDALANGHEVLPMGACDDFDQKSGCRGHSQTGVA